MNQLAGPEDFTVRLSGQKDIVDEVPGDSAMTGEKTARQGPLEVNSPPYLLAFTGLDYNAPTRHTSPGGIRNNLPFCDMDLM